MVECARARLAAVLLVALILTVAVRAEDWPQWRGPNRDGVWSETGILETFPPNGLKILWRAPVGIGFSSPVVADGRVYVTDSELAKPKARERVPCIRRTLRQAALELRLRRKLSGKRHLMRSIRVVRFRRRSSTDGRIYTWGPAGNLFCLDALKGDVVWQKDIQKEYPNTYLDSAGSPLIEGNLLIRSCRRKAGRLRHCVRQEHGPGDLEMHWTSSRPPVRRSSLTLAASDNSSSGLRSRDRT